MNRPPRNFLTSLGRNLIAGFSCDLVRFAGLGYTARALGLLTLLSLAAPADAAVASDAKATPAPVSSAPWVEPNFPFFSSVLDARKAGAAFPENNLTPRGIVLNLGHDSWACFDPDLLRVSAVWQGSGISNVALAPGSYHDDGRKTPSGQTRLPQPVGDVWLANGIYPGWQASDALSLSDPREPAPSPAEVGRGALPSSLGRFEAVRLVGDRAVLEYTVADTRVREWWSSQPSAGGVVIYRHFQIDPSATALHLMLGYSARAAALALDAPARANGTAALTQQDSVWSLRLRAHAKAVSFTISLASGSALSEADKTDPTTAPVGSPALRWPGEIATSVQLSSAKEPYVVDHVALPDQNPWQRRVRPCDIQFLPDGTGVLVTIDGDVWLAQGLENAPGPVRWKRFASGLHEPMSVAIRDGQIYVFDKNGIWRLRDTDGNGEADVHELFSNAFAQTADMREFASTIRLAPEGEFVIAKGGQQDTTLGKHNGSVLRVSADGRTSTVLGYGFRQPSIGVNLRTGLVTASDQQGQYIPSTPLHIVRDGQFYGFLAAFQPKEKYPAPIAEPLTWVPHSVDASALSQVWMFGARMGPLNDGLVQIGFNKPELFHVLLNPRSPRLQAAVVSITRAFDFTPLNGSLNPRDGQLYLAGFQIVGWGNIIDTAAGLGRVRFTGAPVTLPREVVPMDQGVLLRFDVALDRTKATDPTSYSLQSWSYQRTYKYGSPQYKADGTPGQDSLTPSSAYLSADGRGVFIGVPGMKPVMQLRVGWSLATNHGLGFEENAYTTPYELAKFDAAKEGFGAITVDLTPRTARTESHAPASVEEGRRLAQLFACVACHADQAGKEFTKSGPTWKGLYGLPHTVFVGGKPHTVLADEAYLRESILEPSAKIASGFEKSEFAMPSFAGVLNESQVNSLILYIKSLR